MNKILKFGTSEKSNELVLSKDKNNIEVINHQFSRGIDGLSDVLEAAENSKININDLIESLMRSEYGPIVAELLNKHGIKFRGDTRKLGFYIKGDEKNNDTILEGIEGKMSFINSIKGSLPSDGTPERIAMDSFSKKGGMSGKSILNIVGGIALTGSIIAGILNIPGLSVKVTYDNDLNESGNPKVTKKINKNTSKEYKNININKEVPLIDVNNTSDNNISDNNISDNNISDNNISDNNISDNNILDKVENNETNILKRDVGISNTYNINKNTVSKDSNSDINLSQVTDNVGSEQSDLTNSVKSIIEELNNGGSFDDNETNSSEYLKLPVLDYNKTEENNTSDKVINQDKISNKVDKQDHKEEVKNKKVKEKSNLQSEETFSVSYYIDNPEKLNKDLSTQYTIFNANDEARKISEELTKNPIETMDMLDSVANNVFRNLDNIPDIARDANMKGKRISSIEKIKILYELFSKASLKDAYDNHFKFIKWLNIKHGKDDYIIKLPSYGLVKVILSAKEKFYNK